VPASRCPEDWLSPLGFLLSLYSSFTVAHLQIPQPSTLDHLCAPRTQVFQWSLEKVAVDELSKQGYFIAVSDPYAVAFEPGLGKFAAETKVNNSGCVCAEAVAATSRAQL